MMPEHRSPNSPPFATRATPNATSARPGRSLSGTLLLSLTALIAGACDGGSLAPEGHANLSVRFGTSTSQASLIQGGAASQHDALSLQGTNGVLTIEDLRLVVDELELEGDEGACEIPDGDDCADFEFPRFFLDLPLDGGVVTVDTEPVPLGTYKQVEFEVEDVDPDEDDPEDAAEAQALGDEIRDEFPDWPAEASMLVVGTFTPDGGEASPFRTFFEAEVEIEIDLDPHLVIDEEGANRTVTVQVDPRLIFSRPDGTVLDLSQFDFDDSGQLLEFEVEIENAAWEVEFGS